MSPDDSAPQLYTCFQGAGVGFRHPPLDGTMFLNEMVDWHATNNPDHVFAILAQEDSDDVERITYSELRRAIHAYAREILSCLPTFEGPLGEDGSPRVISIVLVEDTLLYVVAILAVLRLGFVAFPISHRNSIQGIEHLMTSVKSELLIAAPVRELDAMVPLHVRKIDELLSGTLHPITLIPSPTSTTLFSRLLQTPIVPYSLLDQPNDDELIPSFRSLPGIESNAVLRAETWPCMIIHSSGSTTFPKPIVWTQQLALTWICAPWYGSHDLGGQVVGTGLALPPFHAIGISTQIGWPFCTGSICAMWLPGRSPAFTTAEKLLSGMIRTSTRFLVTVPDYVQQWAKDKSAMEKLRSLTVLGTGGGSLSKAAGDTMIANGVRLRTVYGITEGGLLFSCYPEKIIDEDWEYGVLPTYLRPILQMEYKNIYRLELEATNSYSPAIFNSECGLRFNTNDLLEEHSTRKGLYRVIGRADDQIVMSNGEKTNPVPIEAIITSHPKIRSSIMFGMSKSEAGIVIEPTEPVLDVGTFINDIWADVQRANDFSPSHSRIFRPLVIVGDPVNKAFPRTAKSTPARFGVLELYAEEIERAYQKLSHHPEFDRFSVPRDIESMTSLVAEVVESVMKPATGEKRILRDVDLFLQGCDSLQVAFITFDIQRTLRSSNMVLKRNDVYQHPTITSLSHYLMKQKSLDDSVDALPPQIPNKEDEVTAMFEKYKSTLESPPATVAPDMTDVEGEEVLVIGGTGSLGCYIVAFLLRLSNVSKVWVINRRSQRFDARSRQSGAFLQRGLTISPSHDTKLVVYEGAIDESQFGLNEKVWIKLRSSVSTVIQTAWRLDFNLRLSSFEPLIKATRNAINFCLNSPRKDKPRLIFTSSIGSVRRYFDNFDGHRVPEEIFLSPCVSLGSGYSESKWVAEMLIWHAVSQCHLSASILRIGQLCGSQVNGSWNESDWFPLIVKSVRFTKALPIIEPDLPVTWLPVDVAADVVVDILNSNPSQSTILHVVHPTPTTWNTVIRAAKPHMELKHGKIELMTFEKWVVNLGEAPKNPEDGFYDRVVSLQEFFQAALASMNNDRQNIEFLGFPRLETSLSEEASSVLRLAKPIGALDVKRWLMFLGEMDLA